MVEHKSKEDEADAYLVSFEASNRKRKLMIGIIAVVLALVAGAVFYMTIGSLGEMSEGVQDAFTNDAAEEGSAPDPEAPASETAPAETSPNPEATATPESAPAPVEGAAPAPEGDTPAAQDATPETEVPSTP